MSQFPAFYLSRRNYLRAKTFYLSVQQASEVQLRRSLRVYGRGRHHFTAGGGAALWQKCVRANPKSRTQN